MATSVNIDHSKPLTVSIVVETEHVVVYRMWKRASTTAAWEIVGDGTTEDDITDAYDLGVLGPGSGVACWFGVAGPKKSAYEIQLVFSQNNQVVNGGTVWCNGTTNDKGGAEREDKVVFP
jgi:hypothetical protein